MTMAAVSFVMFAIAGFVQNALICLPLGIVLTLVVLVVLKKTIGQSVKDITPAKPAVMFAIAGFVQNALICLPLGIVLTLVVLVVLKKTIGQSVKDITPAKPAA